jgi:hypothetical protein
MEAALRVAQVSLTTRPSPRRYCLGPDKEVKENDFPCAKWPRYVNSAQTVSLRVAYPVMIAAAKRICGDEDATEVRDT